MSALYISYLRGCGAAYLNLLLWPQEQAKGRVQLWGVLLRELPAAAAAAGWRLRRWEFEF